MREDAFFGDIGRDERCRSDVERRIVHLHSLRRHAVGVMQVGHFKRRALLDDDILSGGRVGIESA